jgi:hypothetical protein
MELSQRSATSATFDALPPEVILQIFIRVPFSQDDFKALQLVNRRMYQIMAERGWMIFRDIAAEQFPHAVAIKRFPHCSPFAKGLEFVTPKQLSDIGEVQGRFEKIVTSMARVEASMRQEGLNPKYLGTKGWKDNVLTGLYVTKSLQDHIQAAASRLPKPLKLRPVKRAARCKEFIDFLPLSYCLALRHTTLLMVEVIDYLGAHDELYDIRHGRGTGSEFDGASNFSDRTMKLWFENRDDDAFSLALSFFNAKERCPVNMRARVRHLVTAGQRIQSTESHNITEMLSEGGSFRFDHLITRRIAEAIEDWDEFAGGQGKAFIKQMQKLGEAGGEESPSARILIESFLDDLTGF